jgi:pyrroloquinoline quinone biosynthesis protein D
VTATTYRLARGVRLRREDDGSARLLVPEGIIDLNETAAATLALADGVRTFEDIVATLAERYDAPPDVVAADVRELLDTFAERGYVAR